MNVNAEQENRAHRGPVMSLVALALSMACLILQGCHTTRGVGQDIESAGDAIEDAADDAMD